MISGFTMKDCNGRTVYISPVYGIVDLDRIKHDDDYRKQIEDRIEQLTPWYVKMFAWFMEKVK